MIRITKLILDLILSLLNVYSQIIFYLLKIIFLIENRDFYLKKIDYES